MDIRTYVQKFVPKPSSQQFAVLAFDLGVEGDGIHPPEMQTAEFSDLIKANSPSGPWCIQPLEEWRPIAKLAPYHFETEARIDKLLSGTLKVDLPGAVKKDERYNVTDWGAVEKIHSESLLMVPLALRIDRYFEKWRQLPRSISLYSFFSPCLACVEYLEQVRSGNATGARLTKLKRVDVKSWFFAYDEPYVRDVTERPLPKPSKFGPTKDGYMSAHESTHTMGRLEIAGWNVLHPEGVLA